jgi:hypothetical protein
VVKVDVSPRILVRIRLERTERIESMRVGSGALWGVQVGHRRDLLDRDGVAGKFTLATGDGLAEFPVPDT